MFSKQKTQDKRKPAPRVPLTPSIISHGLSVTGDLKTAGELQIDGEIHGNIDCSRLVIGERAEINGEVIADDIVIRGRVNGRVRGNNVTLAKTANVQGDIWHQSLAMESGAHLEGQVRRTEDARKALTESQPKLLQDNTLVGSAASA